MRQLLFFAESSIFMMIRADVHAHTDSSYIVKANLIVWLRFSQHENEIEFISPDGDADKVSEDDSLDSTQQTCRVRGKENEKREERSPGARDRNCMEKKWR